MSSKDQNVGTVLWEFFCSLKLTIVTLILLAATSIIGTIIPQDPGQVAQFRQQIGESTYNLFHALRFFDMYHSWWFLTLLGLFSVNLICCSIKRFPRVWKAVREPVLIADEALFGSLANVEELQLKKPLAVVSEQMAAFLRQHFSAPVITEREDGIYLYAEKGAYARFGVYVTHLSILIIFAGAIIGTVWGYKAYVNIQEGETITQVYPRGSNQPIDLGFSVRCDEFTLSYYPGSQRPREYKSLLTVTDGERVIFDKRPVIVNDPLAYRGINFYQSSYGPAGNPLYTFSVTERKTGVKTEVSGHENEHLALPGGASLIPLGYADSYQNFGPAAQLSIDSGNHQHGSPFVVLQNFPAFDAQRGGDYIVSLVKAKQRYYTGLQVAKDPGVWVVWLGCALMVLGSTTAFFVSHRRIWVVITPTGERTRIRIAGSAHRNQPAFEIYFDALKKSLKTELAA